ncbi:MAG: hypothetical protein E6R08_09950 [Nevskiaceae bacterium]|nr:MAG: hypothetical protein E6R08_09950 [Nevskiaceae bacterium]
MQRVPTRAKRVVALAIVCAVAAVPLPAMAKDGDDGLFGLDLKGSLGKDRHTRYVPPLTNPVFNETPLTSPPRRA